MSVPDPKIHCALITGASSGLGREYAIQLAPRVETLVLVARREPLLEELAKELVETHPTLRIKIIPCDLASPAVATTSSTPSLARTFTPTACSTTPAWATTGSFVLPIGIRPSR